jgi:hypothetical protein
LKEKNMLYVSRSRVFKKISLLDKEEVKELYYYVNNGRTEYSQRILIKTLIVRPICKETTSIT